jgi:hypothetical protein
MSRFEDLPANVRALLLATLAIELNVNRCTNLFELARRRNTDLMTAWRGVCRQSKQPPCTIPQAAAPPH